MRSLPHPDADICGHRPGRRRHVPEKLKKHPWVVAAAWQRNSDHFDMALACDFDVIKKATKKRLRKELNEKQGPSGKILPDLEVTSFCQGGASFRQHFHD